MTAHTGTPAPGLAPGDGGPVWHTLSADGVLRAEEVDEQYGLSSAEAAARAERFGPNKFDAGKPEPRWARSSASTPTLMQIVLLVAGVVSLVLTVFGPLQTFLKTTSLDVRQWFICLAVALSIVVVSEIQKAVRRRSASGQQETR